MQSYQSVFSCWLGLVGGYVEQIYTLTVHRASPILKIGDFSYLLDSGEVNVINQA